MMTIGLNTWNGITSAAKSMPVHAIIGGILGYGYAKFAHLPALKWLRTCS